MKRKLIWIIPSILIVTLAIAFPWYKLQAKNVDIQKQQEALAVAQSFVGTYGNNAKINNVVTPENIKIYGYSWTDGKFNYVSICINGAWVDISKQEIKNLTPIPNP